jgi:flagellar hook-length control protein FliK
MENVTTLSTETPVQSTTVKGSGLTSTRLGKTDLFASLLAGQIEEQPSSTNGSIPSMITQPVIPWFPISQNLAPEELGQVFDQLVALLQNVTPETADAFMEMEEVQQWMAQASALLQTLQGSAQNGSSERIEGIHAPPTVFNETLLPLKGLLDKLSNMDLSQEISDDQKPFAVKTSQLLNLLQTMVDPLRSGETDSQKMTVTSANGAAHNLVTQSRFFLSNEPRNPSQRLSTVKVDSRGATVPETGQTMVMVNRLEGSLIKVNNFFLNGLDGGMETAAVSSVAESGAAALTEGEISEGLLTGQLKQDRPIIEVKPMESMVKIAANQFADEMARFTQTNLRLMLVNGGMSEARISLTPENLGHIDIRITTQQGQVMAHFAAETLAAKELIENQLPQLRAALTQQGLNVDKITITQGQMAGGLFQDQHRGQRFSQSQQQQQRKQTPSIVSSPSVSGYDMFYGTDSLETGSQIKPTIGSGNAFDASA